MEIEYGRPLKGDSRREWEEFISRAGLKIEDEPDLTVLIRDEALADGSAKTSGAASYGRTAAAGTSHAAVSGAASYGKIAAAGSRSGSIIKYLAVDPNMRGEDLTGKLMTELVKDASEHGIEHLFLYTKPANRVLFGGLLFFDVAETRDVLLMENVRGGAEKFVAGLEKPKPASKSEQIGNDARSGNAKIGAVVMNADPFTLGHLALVEKSASECDALCVFVVSEDKGMFPADDRLALVREGTKHIPNVTVNPTGPYLISQATFPTYFMKDRDRAADAKCGLDIEIFCRYFVPAFGITDRYAGTEPLSRLTASYNKTMNERLPLRGVAFHEVERLEIGGRPVSASEVRALFERGDIDKLRELVPQTTFDYLKAEASAERKAK